MRHTTGLNLPEAGSNRNASYGKTHSFHENPIQKQDATAYKHSDSAGTGYKSSSRHLDRRTVRYGGESATDDLSEMKRQLAHTQKMLDDQEDKDQDDRELEKEMDELRFRIKRVQDDIDYYNRRGGRDAGENRRKAERELLHLMHERLPLLEKRLDEKDRKQRDKRTGESRNRDRRNENFESKRGYGDDRRGASYSSSRDEDDFSRSRTPISRGSDRYDDNRRGSPAPIPPTTSKPPAAPESPAPPSPAVSTFAALSKKMTPEEKQAWIQAEAQRRIQERMRALGAAAPPKAPLTPTTTGQADASIEHRLAADRAEANAKAAQADAEAAAREEARRARLEEQRLAQDKAAVKTIKSELKEQERSSLAPPVAVMQAAKEEVNEQEEIIRRREEVFQREKEERLARFKKLEEEEAKRQKELAQPKSSALPAPVRKGKGGPPPPPPSRAKAPVAAPVSVPILAPPAAAVVAPPPPPPAPISPAQTTSAPIVATPSGSSSTNPFHRMQPNGAGSTGGAAAAAAAPVAAPGGTNPFYRSQQNDQSSGLPTPQRVTVPVVPPTAVSTAPKAAAKRAPVDDDDWGVEHNQSDDDDDGPGTTTRATRQNLAQALFSNLVATSPSPSTPTSTSRQAAQSPAPPAAPQAPMAPPPVAASIAAPVGGAAPSRGALLGDIKGGLKLRKAQTNDRSGASVSGAVIGDASAPVQKFVPPPAVIEEPILDEGSSIANSNRQSVDWASHLASDKMNGSAKASALPDEPSVREEDDEEGSDDFKDAVNDMGTPSLETAPNGTATASHAAGLTDELDDFDLSVSTRVRSLYTYQGQREEDLSFDENEIILAHPSKDGSNDWWYGTLVTGSKGLKGTFPKIYVQSVDQTKTAKTLYDFAGSSSEEMSFQADQILQVVDDQDEHWWKVIDEEQRIVIVPSSYVELVNSTG